MGLGRVCVALAMMVAMAPMVWAAEQGDSDKPQAVDFRELKKLFPEKLGDLKRTEASGEKMKMGEYVMSMARAEYAKENDESDAAPGIELEVMDYGGTKGMSEGFSAWANLDLDKESDDGYERTVKVAGHPGLESYRKSEKSGELQLFVGGRFLVHVRVTNLPAEQIKKTAEAYPLDKLAALKPAK
ncbi:MAG TPA: hypothetical protein VHP11_06565 [Tepidisphaeraceae bacterium]|nr:hypothetical protein [Tepidisphaeraceae bacterium]